MKIFLIVMLSQLVLLATNLQEISSIAKLICGDVKQSGFYKKVDINISILPQDTIVINKALKDLNITDFNITDFNVSGNRIIYQELNYSGVREEDINSQLSKNRECKMNVVKTLLKQN